MDLPILLIAVSLPILLLLSVPIAVALGLSVVIAVVAGDIPVQFLMQKMFFPWTPSRFLLCLFL